MPTDQLSNASAAGVDGFGTTTVVITRLVRVIQPGLPALQAGQDEGSG
jgi:hypothetical protein